MHQKDVAERKKKIIDRDYSDSSGKHRKKSTSKLDSKLTEITKSLSSDKRKQSEAEAIFADEERLIEHQITDSERTYVDKIQDKKGDWIINNNLKQKYDKEFKKMIATINSKTLKHSQVVRKLEDLGLKEIDIEKICNLCDVLKDDKYDAEEYAMCRYLADKINEGKDLPDMIPNELIPKSKMHLFL